MRSRRTAVGAALVVPGQHRVAVPGRSQVDRLRLCPYVLARQVWPQANGAAGRAPARGRVPDEVDRGEQPGRPAQVAHAMNAPPCPSLANAINARSPERADGDAVVRPACATLASCAARTRRLRPEHRASSNTRRRRSPCGHRPAWSALDTSSRTAMPAGLIASRAAQHILVRAVARAGPRTTASPLRVVSAVGEPAARAYRPDESDRPFATQRARPDLDRRWPWILPLGSPRLRHRPKHIGATQPIAGQLVRAPVGAHRS